MRLRGRSDREEIRRVYRDHVDAVYAFFAYAVTHAVAEDLTSSTFERVVRAWSGYDPARAGERTWILAIARNLLRDHFRRQKHRDAVSTDEHPAVLEALVTSDEPYARTLEADELRSWLRCLGEREREIVALRYAADLPATEIADLVELTPANVHQILSRSVRRLREAAEAEAMTREA